jgi:hypothetical protein
MARSGGIFLVNLAGLDISDATLNEIEKEISSVVDRKIAGIAKLKGKVGSVPLGPEIRGKFLMPADLAKSLGSKGIG